MANTTGVRIRVSDALKSEWQARARADGITLSHLLRVSARLGILLGPARLKDAIAAIGAMRRDLHAVVADLNRLAQENTADSEQLRATLASAHEAAEATSAFLRRR